MKKIILLLFLIPLFGLTSAQHFQPTRVDIKVKKDWGGFNTIACGENGVISLYFKYKGNALLGREKTMYVSLFDENLEEIWKKSIRLNPDLTMIDYRYDSLTENVYLLFAESTNNRGVVSLKFSKNTMLDIITIKPEKESRRGADLLSKTSHEIALPSLNVYNEMLPVNDKLFIFTTEVRVPLFSQCCSPVNTLKTWMTPAPKNYVYQLNIERGGDNKSISLNHGGKYYRHKTVFLDNNQDIKYLVQANKVAKSKVNAQKLYTIDHESGSVKDVLLLDDGTRVDLQYPSAVKHNDEIIFVAMYGEDKSNVESGLLFRYFDDNEKDFEQTFSLKEVAGKDNRKQFLGLFSSKEQTNMRFHNHSYSLDKEGNYLVIGERLSPYYETYYTYVNGSHTSYTVHVGWTYHEAYLMAFNDDHKLIWRNVFDMGNTTVYNINLVPRLMVKRLAEDKITLMFGAGDQISSLLIEDAEVDGKQNFFTLKSQFKKSRIKADYIPSIEHWYKDYFIASGYVDVKKSDFFLSGKDKIYYFTKLKYEKR
ncbi:MAG: hypothetical protein R6T91_01420 [Bacteroidales bacterium]